MRLHLPKALLAAVLAACLAWPAGAFTSTTTDYPTGSSTTTTFNGDIWTWNNSGTNIGSGDGARFTNYSTGTEYAGNDTITGPGIFYNYFFNGSETDYLGNTLRFNGANANKTLTTDWSNYIWIGGIITEAGNYSYTLGRDGGTNFKLSGGSAVNMVINSSFTCKTNSGSSVAVEKGGTWSIAKGKTLTFDTGTTTISDNQTVNVSASGDGTGNASLTFSGAVTNNGTLNIGSNVLFSASNTITNTGSINFSSGATINLDAFQPTSTTLNDSNTTGVKTWTGSWTLATGGTVTTEDGVIYQYKGKSATGGSISDGVISANGNYFNITSGDEKTYTEATADDSINFINVLGKLTGVSDSSLTHTIQGDGVVQVDAGDTLTYSTFKTNAGSFTGSLNILGTLSGLSGTITTTIGGSGTLSMSAGTGEVTIAADKLTDFTGDLMVNSGRYKAEAGSHVFRNVDVSEGGQFFIADGVTYGGDISIAGTGWSKTADLAWNGALRLEKGATLSGKLTLTGDACIMAYNGANVTLAGNVDAGSYELIANGSGTLNITKDASIGSLHAKASSITIGDGTNASVTTATRIEHGDAEVTSTTLTVSANSVLKITGNTNAGSNEVGDYKILSAVLGEWRASTTANISGTVLAENAKLLAGDTGFTLNIKSNGLVATKGIDRAVTINNPTITVNLEGGSLILGDSGIAANGTNHSATSTGGVIGSYANTTTIATGLSLTSGTTTIDTSKYTINTDNTVTVGEGAPGSTITIDGIISGSGTLKVSGGGILVLNGNNTYTNETRLSGGEIQAGNANAFGTGKLIVDGKSSISGTATIGDYIGIEENVALTIKENSAITLGNTGTNKGMWVKAGSSVVLENGASVTGYGVTVSHLNEKSKLAAESGGEGQFGISGQLNEEKLTIKESAISLADQATLRNTLDGGTVSSTGSTTIGWLDENGTHGGGSISSLADTSASDTLKVASDLAVTKSAAIAGTLNIGEKATTAINSAREDDTASSIGTLTGSGTLKATGGTTEVTNASGFSGTLAATGGNIELQTAADLTLSEVVVSGGSSISGATSYTADNVSIGKGAAGSLVGNLSINDNGTITLDASAGATTETGGTKGLSLSALTTTFADEGTTTTAGSLTLGSGLTLNLLNLDLKRGQSLTLFSGVTSVNGLSDDNLAKLTTGTLAAEDVFSGVGAGDFNLSYSNSIVAIVANNDVPEPTTATLSLLALMGLAARRRRRKA